MANPNPVNVNNSTMDPVAKARKQKKKIPKPGVRVKPPKKKAQTDEIPIPRNAPNAEEHGNRSSQASVALGLQANQRMKKPIVRPQIPPTTTTTEGTPATRPPLTSPSSNLHNIAPTGVLVETMAATSSGTAARLYRFIPIPGFRPPKLK
ncbi:hypothetical protein PIB30_023745 [Stylosanthes scabra]|uniref:Uncharacterized protein n=1 Tax=Stylosanthes scabra TaxID=79078 RepID=A0ABU6WAI3_9FABA|nr:hypothetical protein [Stylosanthes scabra]